MEYRLNYYEGSNVVKVRDIEADSIDVGEFFVIFNGWDSERGIYLPFFIIRSENVIDIEKI